MAAPPRGRGLINSSGVHIPPRRANPFAGTEAARYFLKSHDFKQNIDKQCKEEREEVASPKNGRYSHSVQRGDRAQKANESFLNSQLLR